MWNAAGLVDVSSANTHPGLTKGVEAESYRKVNPDLVTFFRICGTDDLQGSAGAQLARGMGIQSVYIVDDDDTYGKGIADLFEIAFKAAGGTVLGHEQTAITQRDYHAVIEHIVAIHPQAVYFGANGIELGTFRQQMARAGIGSLPFFAGDAMGEDVYPKTAGAHAVGSYFTVTSPDGAHLDNKLARRFTARYEQRYHAEPGPFDIGAYVAGEIEAAAIKKAVIDGHGAFPTRGAVLANVAHTRDFVSPIGEITFDEQGDTHIPYISFYTFTKSLQQRFVNQFIMRAR